MSEMKLVPASVLKPFIDWPIGPEMMDDRDLVIHGNAGRMITVGDVLDLREAAAPVVSGGGLSGSNRNGDLPTSAEEIARIIAREFMRQDHDPDPGEPFADGSFSWSYVDQGEVDFLQIANAVLTHQAATPDGSGAGPGGWLIKDFADGWIWTDRRIAAVAALTDGHSVFDLNRQEYAPLPAAPEGGLGSFSQAAKIPTVTAVQPVLVPRDQLETLRRSLQLGNLLPGEGETLINCWIMASEAESKV